MSDHRPGKVAAALIAALLVLAAQPAAPVAAHSAPPTGLRAFMWAVAQVESGGRYDARNRKSGAYGKYQIMPMNWPVWAGRYLSDPKARPTPKNQEKVARARFIALYRWLGTWHRVAYWWLTGRTIRDPERWSETARWYVSAVISLYRRARAREAPVQAAVRSDPLPVRITTGWLHLRRGPGTRYAVLGYVKPGYPVRVIDSTRDPSGRVWYQFQPKAGPVGWISSKYTREP